MAFDKYSYVRSLVTAKLTNRRRLLSMSLCVTNRCNIKCLYCYGDYFFRPGKNPQVLDLRRVIDEACELGLQHLYLTGGEPLMRSDIDEVIDHAHGKGLRTGMVSNGFFIPRHIKKLSKLDKVVLSLDGREAANDANRGENCFAKVQEAIKCCQENGLAFDLKMVLNRSNAKELPWMLDYVESLGVKLEVVLAYAPKSDLQKMQHGQLMLDDTERLELTQELLRYKREGRALMFATEVYENMERWSRFHDSDTVEKDQRRDDFPYIKCNAGVYHAFVDGDGCMYPCNQLIGNFEAKNVVEVGVAAAWDHLQTNRCVACNVSFLNHQHLAHDLYLTYPARKAAWKLKHGALAGQAEKMPSRRQT